MNNQTAYDIEYGLHSNIPDCCVDFFVATYDRLTRTNPDGRAAYVDDQYKAERFWGRVWNYVACPDCRDTGYHRELHVCAGECEGLYLRLQVKHGLMTSKEAAA